ncbi:MAG TPA: DUF1206 domain-containing protein [Actinomadura sp.]|nr:DUF1206 domain-containing protein [Actinomadura sp.]
MTVGQQVKTTGRRASSGHAMQFLARAGLTALGVIYILVGSLAVEVAFGDTDKNADRQGALRAVGETPGGTIILWLLVLGFFGLALWRFAEAALGATGPDGQKATKRLSSLGAAVVYTGAFISIASFVLGQGGASGDKQSKNFTAEAMSAPGGRWLVLAVGLGLIGYGVACVVNAVRRTFLKRLKRGEMTPAGRKVVEKLGIIGCSARGVVFGSAGVFLADAAIRFDPDRAKGLDGTLREFAKTPAGPWLLVVIALGLVTYAVYCFCEARWRRVDPG